MGGGQWNLGRGGHFLGPRHPDAPEAKKTCESPRVRARDCPLSVSLLNRC